MLYVSKVICTVMSVQHLVSLLVGQCKLLSWCVYTGCSINTPDVVSLGHIAFI